MASLCSTLECFNISFHIYADDVYLYLPSTIRDLDSSIKIMEKTLKSVADWMFCHHLALNPSKTETMLFHNRNTPLPLRLQIDVMNSSVEIRTDGCLRLLGVLLDPHLEMDKFVNDKCRSTYIQIRMLSLIRPRISLAHAKMLSQALVLSRIDYCIVLLCGALCKLTDKLQRVVNHTARIVTGSSRRESSSPLLLSLNWPSIQVRIKVRQASLLFYISRGTAPHYLQGEVSVYKPSRQLRSSQKNLVEPQHSKRRIGNMAIRYWASRIWNSLPEGLREEQSFSKFHSGFVKHLSTLK
jgi:hypothetical protein